MTCNISHGSCAWFLPCTHQSENIDVISWEAPSTTTCVLCTRNFSQTKAASTMRYHHGMPASVVACAHFLVIVGCVKWASTRGISLGVSALVRWHQWLPAGVEQATSTNSMQQQLIHACINYGMCSSPRWHRSWPVRINLTTLFNGKQHHIRHACIGRGVCASTRRHQSWHTCIGQATSANDMLH